ncbi:alpha/beta hydrolase-fold protein [Sphingomonas donggukensis]|uniref:Alpha/beta hydrolase-fold protein n=1 Tax=Sphingomonas donggukensis TaxID=2949093 RepID=A0ABY4U180_9SPHN|nr:alpha/beta hydrolase-fold protein [Sphingomonas donggukensis]URW77119.1 alpha/beta hydrolase-fold protein [Sphingomonas donggukensis]
MRWIAALLLAFASAGSAQAQQGGRFDEMFVTAGAPIGEVHATVWLPPGYDAGKQRYGVVYMQDGQNVFVPARSGFNKVWGADKAVTRLVAAGRIAPLIVVAIDHPGKARYRQYFPQALYAAATPAVRAVFDKAAEGPITGDAYVDLLAHTLKPMIDRAYRTRRDAAHTGIIGSSMGGLISCYAFVRRPRVFGRAGCVSTHWLLTMPADLPPDADVLGLWETYLAANLGKTAGRRLWMDHGTETLDANYAPWQARIDAAVTRAGWVRDRDFASREYKGAAHEENAWAARLDDILAWLFA